jgi:23S rRNA pseudouridine1911/1915/1917 synthase
VPLHILYEDNHVLVVDKPAGVLVQPDRTGDRTLIDLVSDDLRRRFQKPGNVFVGVVHRLDRPVSGALLLARTSKAAARLSEQFRSGGIEKTYLALVEQPPAEAAGVLVHSLLKDPATNTVRLSDPQAPGARTARLRYQSLGPHPGGTLIEVHLETGRAHQIRVQLAAIGCVVVGDMRYGSTRPLGAWIALHASRVAFTHPTRGDRIEVTAPLPGAWETLD